jgi:HK97 family phage prohead protease
MSLKVKTASVELKAVAGQANTYEAIVSVFGNVDHAGDRMVFGAFENSLKDWAAQGDQVPVIFAHQWANPLMHVGAASELKEIEGGLWARFTVDTDDDMSRKVAKLLDERRVREFSFAYEVVRERKASDGANELLEVNLFEIGPCLKGMNPDTQLLALKSYLDDIERRNPADDGGDDVTDTKSDESGRGKQKARLTLDGSYEQLQERLKGAVNDWASTAFPGVDVYLAGLEATYAESAVVYVESWSDPWGGGDYYKTTYDVAEDHSVTFGDPEAVELTGVVTPKCLSEASGGKKAAKSADDLPPDHGHLSSAKSVAALADLYELDCT